MKIEDRLRRDLARRVADVLPSDDAWSSVSERLHGISHKSRAHRVAIAAFALALSLGSMAMLWRVFFSERPVPSIAGSSPAQVSRHPTVVATIRVGPFPSGVAIADSSIWVGAPRTRNECAGALDRIDVSSNLVVGAIPVHGSVISVAGSANAVWAAINPCSGAGDSVVRIDPQTDSVVATIPLQDGLADIAMDGSEVWVTQDTNGLTGHVIHIDPSSNLVVASTQVDGRLRDVVVGEGSVWVLDTSTYQGSVLRIDPSSDTLVASIQLGASPQGLAVGEGAVWATENNQPVRIDPRTNEIVVQSARVHGGFRPLVVGEGGVWFAGLDPQGSAQRIAHLNARTLQVDASIRIDQYPVAAALDDVSGTLWVDYTRRYVVRIDLRVG